MKIKFWIVLVLEKMISLLSSSSRNLALANVHPQDIIRFQTEETKTGFADARCLSNDPKTKRILVEIEWENTRTKEEWTEERIWKYSAPELQDFDFLNPNFVFDEKVVSLEKQLQQALKAEDYETASKLRDELKNQKK